MNRGGWGQVIMGGLGGLALGSILGGGGRGMFGGWGGDYDGWGGGGDGDFGGGDGGGGGDG
jgi:hypothetical protein